PWHGHARAAARADVLQPHSREVRLASALAASRTLGQTEVANLAFRMERKWWTLLAVCVATFMLLLDITVVNVALPDIQSSLGASLSSLQWVVDAYSLTLAAFLLTAGSLADRMGRRRVFTFGFLIFTAASFLCGISPNATLLNLARGLRRVRASQPHRDARSVPVPKAGVRGRVDSGLRAVRRHVRDVPLHHALRAGRAGLLAARRGAPVPPAHAALVLRGAGGREALRA